MAEDDPKDGSRRELFRLAEVTTVAGLASRMIEAMPTGEVVLVRDQEPQGRLG